MKSITARELASNKDESFPILDIRKVDSFRDWHIKNSENIDVYNDIWEGNFDTVEKIKNFNANLIQAPRQMAEQLEFGPNRCASQ